MTRWVRGIERWLAVGVATTEAFSALGVALDVLRLFMLCSLAAILIVGVLVASPRRKPGRITGELNHGV